MIDIKQYLKETNTVLLTEQAYKYLKEKASVIEKLEAIKTEMDIIAELEKIREELHETAEMHSNGNYYLRDEWIDEYIDKHISELKGENK